MYSAVIFPVITYWSTLWPFPIGDKGCQKRCNTNHTEQSSTVVAGAHMAKSIEVLQNGNLGGFNAGIHQLIASRDSIPSQDRRSRSLCTKVVQAENCEST